MPIPTSLKPAFKGRRRHIKNTVNAMKARPCVDCGGTFPPCAMDFDHLEGSDKTYVIGRMVSGGAALDAIMREAAKCDIVCANCHRIRTWRRGANSRRRIVEAAPINQRGLFEPIA